VKTSNATPSNADVHERAFSIPSPRPGVIDGDVRWSDGGPAARPVVIFAHGFKGFKDWGPRPDFGRFLARQGFVSVMFNFSYNGVAATEPMAFTEKDLFERNTYTRELDDLEAVTDAVAEARAGAFDGVPLDAGRIGLVGHSRGGGIAIVRAERDRRVRALVTWASVAGFVERFTPEQVHDWLTDGFATTTNSRTGETLRLGRVLYDDALDNRMALDVMAAARRLGAKETPWLVVHAPDDEAVAYADAERLAEAGGAQMLTADGGHTFGGAHPHDTGADVPASLRTVWTRTASFLQKHLASENAT
jgi:pimeloyl-ACP methyl ester carboxylesterase